VHDRTLLLVDRSGATPVRVPPQLYSEARFSPDGEQIALDIRAANDDIWTYDIARGTFARLTFTHGNNQAPIWSPDGSRIVYAVDRVGVRRLAWKPSDESGDEELLTPAEFYQTPGSFSADGRRLAYMEDRPQTGSDIFVLPLDGPRKPIPFLATPVAERHPSFAPDGHWIAYESNETGRSEVFVAPYPGPGRKWQISREGGWHPVWLNDGTSIVYATNDSARVMLVKVTTAGGALGPGVPTEILKLPSGITDLDVSPDGQRALAIVASGNEGTVHELNVALNWSAALKTRVR